jgi:hypothetical protein
MQDLLTLAPGVRKRRFRAEISAGERIRIETGHKGSGVTVSWSDYKRMVSFFRAKGFFLLGNRIDEVRSGSLGEYFKYRLKKSPKYASHFAAIMVYLKDAKVVGEKPLTLRII